MEKFNNPFHHGYRRVKGRDSMKPNCQRLFPDPFRWDADGEYRYIAAECRKFRRMIVLPTLILRFVDGY